MGLGTKIEKEGIDAVTKAIKDGTNQEIERRNHFKENLKILCV